MLAGAGRPDARLTVLYLRPDLVRRPRASCEVLDNPPLLRALVDHLVRLESLPSNRAGRRLASVLVDQIDGARRLELRLPTPQHPRAIHVADLLMSDPSDTLSLVALGHTLSISARTLARHFISDTGVTLGQWRRQFRLTHALTLVARGSRSKMSRSKSVMKVRARLSPRSSARWARRQRNSSRAAYVCRLPDPGCRIPDNELAANVGYATSTGPITRRLACTVALGNGFSWTGLSLGVR